MPIRAFTFVLASLAALPAAKRRGGEARFFAHGRVLARVGERPGDLAGRRAGRLCPPVL